MTTTREDVASAGGRLVATDGRELPLTGARLGAQAGGGLARTRLEQTFKNPHTEPLTVTYQLPLPADGAVSAFAFRVGDRRVVGEIDKREAARERFEQALAGGHSAALLEQDRSSLFTQEIGNIPPGAEIVAELEVDQPLAWLAEGEWEWRFPTTVAPRFLGYPGRTPDAERIHVDVAESAIAARMQLELTLHDAVGGTEAVSSPSHALHTVAHEDALQVAFRGETGAPLDRDIVVRWTAAASEPGAALSVARLAEGLTRNDAFGLLTLVPPTSTDQQPRLARDLCILLDTSGSMGGPPLERAKRVVSRMIGTLEEHDRLEMIEFSTKPRRWERKARRMTAARRADAQRWLSALKAGGGTQMKDAILDALTPLGGEAQRQVVLVSDGLIGFESEIVAAILEHLPAASRVHTVGVGSSVNRSLTAAAARAGHGVEILLGLDEDLAAAAQRIVACTEAPLIVDVELSGSALTECAPVKLPDLFAASPALVSVRLAPEGGELRVRGRTADGTWSQELCVPACEPGVGRAEIVTRFGRELVEDLEMRVSAQHGSGNRLEAEIEGAGLAFGIATRRTSWVAVSNENDVDPTAPARREGMPHELPYGLSVEGLGLRGASTAHTVMALKIDMAARRQIASKPSGILERFKGRFVPDSVNESMRAGPMAGRSAGDSADDEESFHAESFERRHARTSLKGRLVLSRAGTLVFELESSGALWQLPGEVTLACEDGSRLTATVVEERSTRAGTHPAGTLLRLTVEVPAGEAASSPTRVTWTVDGCAWIVELK